MAAESIPAIEPLPHPVKLSRNLYATLDPLDHRGESPLEGTKPPELRHTGKAAEQNVSDPRHFSPLEIRFNHGEDLPTDLLISLTPGAWEPRLVRMWRQHFTSFAPQDPCRMSTCASYSFGLARRQKISSQTVRIGDREELGQVIT
ncbi:unnamed protein product [Ascophyllum nodosum]